MRMVLERRAVSHDSLKHLILYPLGAFTLAILVCSLLFLPFGASPAEGFGSMIGNAFFSLRGFGYTLVTATPLILVGLGTIVAWRCGFIFLGFEGCLLVGAAGGTAVALGALEGGALAGLPPIIVTFLSLLGGAVCGAIWSGIVGELRVRFGGNEVLMALMMNFIAIYLVQYLVVGPLRAPGELPQTPRIPKEIWLPFVIEGTRAHAGIIIALIMGLVVYLLMEKTRAGYELVVSGLNVKAARYSGIHVGSRLRQAALIAGCLAGLAGAIEILGIHHRLLDGLSDGTGFLGIVTALLGRMTVLGTAIASVLYGGLSVGGDAMQRQTGLPSSIVLIIQALIVLLLLASELFRTHRITFVMSREK